MPRQPVRLARNLSFIIVEDEPLLSMVLEEFLGELGHTSPVVCDNIESALAALDVQSFDGAFLDLNLHGKPAAPIAAKLKAKRIPFVIATGGSHDAEKMGALMLVLKPYLFSDIEHAVSRFTN